MMKDPSETMMPGISHPIIALIFARGGSKGVTRKNARRLGDIPLLAYTVAMAAKMKAIDRVVVSTEDHELAEIAKAYGGEVPFLRPEHLAQDDSNLNDVLKYTCDRLKEKWGIQEQYTTVTMFPTSPFRNMHEMESLLEKAKNGFHVSTVNSVLHSKDTLFSFSERHALHPLLPNATTKRKFYRFNGYCLIHNRGNNSLPNYLYEIKNPISLIDIDHWEDFFLAEKVVQHKLFDFGMDF